MFRAFQWSTDIIGRQMLSAIVELPLHRIPAIDKHQDAKKCALAKHVCGHLALLVFLAFLFAECAVCQPTVSSALPGITPANAGTHQTRRRNPFYWGTNAVLYDDQDVELIGSLGKPGKIGARITFYWSDIEPTQGNWQFTVYDDLVKRAASAQIPLLGVLAYAMKRVASAAGSTSGAPWALSFCPPDEVEQFATFAGMVAARYPQVLDWEIWNEPNTAYFWRPSPDPSAYVELLRRSYAAVKAANPNARVAIGGMSPGNGNSQVNTMSAASFLESVYQNGGKDYFDAVAFHPYNDGVSPDLYLEDYMNSVHDVMTEYGDGSKRVWVTEIGWFVGAQANGVSQAEQADYLSRASTRLYNLEFVDHFYWYNLKDYADSTVAVTPSPASVCGPAIDNPVDYGIFRFDGSPRPAADAFKNGATYVSPPGRHPRRQ